MNEGIRPRVSIGLVVFFLMMVSMLFVAPPIQETWGMWGLALTELMLLAWAVIPALILKWDFREVFRMRIPAWRQVFGTLVLWVGGFVAVMAVNIIITYFFPKGMHDVSTDLLDFFNKVPFPVRLFILAAMPAICEEALHRGFIQYTFRNTSKWTTIISMSLIFGLFHLDPYRFLGTAILGAVLTYIMVETRNILLPMLFHFVNNVLGALSTLATTPSVEVMEIPLASVGMYLLMVAAVPFLFIGGSRLLLSKEERITRPISKSTWKIAIVMVVVLALSGIAVFGVGAMELLEDYMAEPIFENSFSQDVNKDTPDHLLGFTVEEARAYQYDLSIIGTGDVITQVAVISCISSEEVYSGTGGEMTGQGSFDLAAGDYMVIISFFTESEEYLPVSVEFILK